MTVNEAVEQILYCSKTTENTFITENTEIIAVCRFSTDDEFVKFDIVYENVLKISKMELKFDFMKDAQPKSRSLLASPI